jgi:hypothetical protein
MITRRFILSAAAALLAATLSAYSQAPAAPAVPTASQVPAGPTAPAAEQPSPAPAAPTDELVIKNDDAGRGV